MCMTFENNALNFDYLYVINIFYEDFHPIDIF